MNLFGLIGGLLLVLGFATGAALLVEPLGLLPAQVGVGGGYLSLWLFFVAFIAVGFTLFSFSARDKPGADRQLVVNGGLLLLIGVLAAVGLFLSATGFVNARGTWSWWLLFLGGISVGTVAVLMGNRVAKDI